MTVEFHCLEAGRRLYAVREFGTQLFVGSQAECDRFQEIHRRKVLDERSEQSRVFRHRPFVARTYRAERLHA